MPLVLTRGPIFIQPYVFRMVVVAKQRIRNYFHNSREIPTHSAREATVPWRQTSTGTFDLRSALNYQTNKGIQPESLGVYTTQ